MDIKGELYTYLQSKVLLTALVDTRVYPEEAPQGATIPYLTYEFTDGDGVNHLQGAAELASYFFTIKVHADTSVERNTITEALRNILHSRRNFYLVASSIHVRECWLQGRPHDSTDSRDDGSEEDMFCAEMDFKMTLVETAPTLP